MGSLGDRPLGRLTLLIGSLAAHATMASPSEDLAVRRGTFTSRLVLTGELVAEEALPVVVPNANIWPVQIRWLAEDGARIAAGETIVEFDNSQLASNLEQLEQAALDAANTLTSEVARGEGQELEALFTLRQKRAELDKARIDSEVPPQILSAKEYEERRLALRRAELEHEQAREALRLERLAGEARIEKQRIAAHKAELAVRRAREGIRLLTVPAPRAGVLLVGENAEEARTFQTGDRSWPGTTLATLPDLESMIVEAWLYDVDDGRLAVGMPVTATVDAFPAERWSGEIFAIDSVATAIGRSLRRAFRVRIRLDDLDVERMLPGMSVQAIVESRQDDVLTVPRAALRWRDADGVLEAEAGRPGGARRTVRLGECNPQECVVLEGLEEGERLEPVRYGEEP